MSNSNRVVALILGAGEVGTAIARELLRRDIEVAVHCRRPLSLDEAIRELQPLKPSVQVVGDLAVPLDDLRIIKDKSGNVPRVISQAIDGVPCDLSQVSSERLDALFTALSPKFVIDATNLATTLSFLPSQYRANEGESTHANTGRSASWLGMTSSVFKGHAIAIHRALRSGKINTYLKVSTTGLGRRGLDVPFTHGDRGEFLSAALWHKVALAGINHQLLWALARSFPGQVRLIIPAAFVGFEQIEHVLFGAKDGPIHTLGAGEERHYSREELATISSVHQMGTVTKEEVARTVFSTLLGSDSTYDLLSAMSKSTIKESSAGYRLRHHVLARMRMNADDDAALVTGSLGPRVGRALFWLRILKGSLAGRTLNDLLADPSEVKVSEPVLTALLSQAKSLGIHLIDGEEDAESSILQSAQRFLDSLSLAVVAGVRTFLSEQTDVDRLELDQLLADISWSEGELLAILWRDCNAESFLL